MAAALAVGSVSAAPASPLGTKIGSYGTTYSNTVWFGYYGINSLWYGRLGLPVITASSSSYVGCYQQRVQWQPHLDWWSGTAWINVWSGILVTGAATNDGRTGIVYEQVLPLLKPGTYRETVETWFYGGWVDCFGYEHGSTGTRVGYTHLTVAPSSYTPASSNYWVVLPKY
jgi:hypothetical protein